MRLAARTVSRTSAPTADDVQAFCSELEQIKSVGTISARLLRQWHKRVVAVNKKLEGKAGVALGAVMQVLEEWRAEDAGEDGAYMLDLDAVKHRFRDEADNGTLGNQFWGDRVQCGAGYPPILSFWSVAQRATSARVHAC